jgi:hypothetical protein
MKSPGSMICSRATSWQMPGETPFLGREVAHAGVALELALQLAQRLDLAVKPAIFHLVGVDQVVLEDGEACPGSAPCSPRRTPRRGSSAPGRW